MASLENLIKIIHNLQHKTDLSIYLFQFSSVQLLSCVRLFVTPFTSLALDNFYSFIL